MKKIFISVVMGLLASGCSLKNYPSSAEEQSYYLFAYYTYDKPQAGIRLALSRDGYHWTQLKGYDGAFVPAKKGIGEMSDCPSIVKSPDGHYHMVWGTGLTSIGYAKSTNLQDWEDVRKIDISGGELGKPMTIWAPELFYDPALHKYVIIFTASTKKVPGLRNAHKGNHKAFAIMTDDFHTFTKPKKFLHPDPHAFYIDPYVLLHNGTYYTFLKIEAHNTVDGEKDGLHYTTSPSLFGPHRRFSATLDRATGDAEGPTILRLHDHWLLLYDTGHGRRGALGTEDLKLWLDVTDRVQFPEGYRHGTAITIDQDLYRELERKYR